VVSTYLKHISQIGSFPQLGVKIKNTVFETTSKSSFLHYPIPSSSNHPNFLEIFAFGRSGVPLPDP